MRLSKTLLLIFLSHLIYKKQLLKANQAMDLFTPCKSLVITIVLASLLFLMFIKTYIHSIEKKLAPKAKGGWPIIGHLPLLIFSDQLPHKLLGSMADMYGPIFRIDLGVTEALVISSSEMAKECLETKDKSVLGRGRSVGIELMGYNYAMFGFSPYGPYWRHMRKIVTLELLSTYRCNAFSSVFESEVSRLVKKMYTQWMVANNNSKANKKMPLLVDLTKVFAQLTLNVTVRLVFGKQLHLEDGEQVRRIHGAIKGFLKHMGSFAIGDALPFLRWFDFGGQEKAMKECFKELDCILQGWLDEHKQKNKCSNLINKNDVDKDFMGIMLSILDDEDAIKEADYDADTINKATCLGMLLGGSDTTAVTLNWAFSLLLNNPEALRKAKEELNISIGKERQVCISDIPKLVYLEAIVKETMRLHPAGPLMAPREFMEDCIIGDYHVRNGTRLIVNVSKISRDPKVWDNPLEFRPERFLDTHKNVDVKGHHFELIPFGAGRRICPGISFGLCMVHLSLASLLHAFEFSTQKGALVDLSESFGLSCDKAKPLQVLLKPSLSSEAYVLS